MKRFVCMLLILVLSVSMLASCDELSGTTADMESLKESMREELESSIREELENGTITDVPSNGGENAPGEDTGSNNGGESVSTTPGGDTSNDPIEAPSFTIPEGGYDPEHEVTITFYHTMGMSLRSVLVKYIAEFNKLYPNITVRHEQVGSYDDVRDQIKTEISVGNPPNIAYCYPDHVVLYNQLGATVSLDALIESDISVSRTDGTSEILGLTDAQKADFISGFYEEGRAYGDGKMYTLPMSKSTEVLYYNKTFFERNDLAVPTTWDEMEAVCKKIKEIDPDSIPLGYDSEANWFITMCMQMNSNYTSAMGEEKFLFDNPENRAFVERFRNWYQNGWVTTAEISQGYTSDLFTKFNGDPGNCYMCIASSAGAFYLRPNKNYNGEYDFEVGIASIPQVNVNAPKAIMQGPSLCIFDKADPQEVLASWLFVKFLTTNVEFQAEFSLTSGYIPVIHSVTEHPSYKEYLNLADGGDFIQALAVKQGLEQMDAYFSVPGFVGSSVAREQVGLLMQECFIEQTNDVPAMIAEKFKEAIDACKYQTK